MVFQLDTKRQVFAQNAQDVASPTPYAIRITPQGWLEYREGLGLWQAFDPQPPVEVTHLAADNNRVFIRLADKSLHWCVLRTDIGAWVDYNFRVISDLVSSSNTLQTLLDTAVQSLPNNMLDTELAKLFAVPDLWPNGQVPTQPSDRVAAIRDWLAAYRARLNSAHATPPGALHGPWTRIRRGPLPGEPGPEDPDVIDIAVGNWHHTVTTLYVMLGTGRILYLDEEPMMPFWRAVPGTETPQIQDSSGLRLRPDAILTASHSVLAILQPGLGQVSFRRWDYHNPSDFMFFPLVNWTESGWTHRKTGLTHPEAIGFDTSFTGPGGTPRPWDVPLPHPFILHLRRSQEQAILTELIRFLDWPPVADLAPLIAAATMVLGHLISLPEDKAEATGPLPSLNEIRALISTAKTNPAISFALRNLRQIETDLRAQLDEPRVSPVPGTLARQAETLSRRDMGTAMMLWTLIREASGRIDAAAGRRSSVGTFGDNPIKPNGAYPIDIWVRDASGTHRRTTSADARGLGSMALTASPETAARRPQTVSLQGNWQGKASGLSAGPPPRIRRSLRVSAPDRLGSGALYDWSLSVAGAPPQTQRSSEPSATFAVEGHPGDSLALSLSARDSAGAGLMGLTILKMPTPELALSVDIARSTPFGAPQDRPLETADGSAMTPVPVRQQGYGPIALRVHGGALGPGPYRLAWQATHHRRGVHTVDHLPTWIDLPTLPGTAPSTMISPGLGTPSVVTPTPVLVGGTTPQLSLSQPERFSVTVTLTDGAGQTAQARLTINPWRPAAAQQASPGGVAPSGPALPDPVLRELTARLEDLAATGRMTGLEDLQTALAALSASGTQPPALPDSLRSTLFEAVTRPNFPTEEPFFPS